MGRLTRLSRVAARISTRAGGGIRALFSPVAKRRPTEGRVRQGLYVFSLSTAVYHLVSQSVFYAPLDLHLAVHLCAVLAMTFLLFGNPGRGRLAIPVLDIVLVVLCLVAGLYFLGSLDTLLQRALVITPLSTPDVLMAGLLLLLTFEGARRTVGLPFVLIMGSFILLMYFGPYLPGIWAHSGISAVDIIDLTVWTRLQGIWGIPLRMSATLIALFVIFGKLVQYSGLTRLFTAVCQALAGGARGGPAKIAVVGSALVGSVTAGPVTNMLMTGSLTIPMMKEVGYKPHYAGAVEAAASTGASIVPPIMTGIVFIMAELTGTSYVRIMLLAVIPATLYYTCLLLQVHFQAVHTGMRGSGRRTDFFAVRREVLLRGHLLLPVVVLVALLIKGYYPAMAVLWAIPVVPLAAALRRDTRMGLRLVLQALAEAAQELVRVAPVCALSGIVIVALFQTGLGSTFSHIVSGLAGQSLLLLAVMGAVACLVLGTGVPPTPAYLVTVLIVAPLMVKSGIPVVVAHFFALYYANIAFITPPIAVGALVAAGISGAGFWPTSIVAVRLAAVGFAIPIAFVYRPALLLFGGPLDVLWALAACVVLAVCLASAFEGWMLRRLPFPARLLLVGAGLALIPPHAVANVIALAVVVAVVVLQLRERVPGAADEPGLK
jgi:TRAP transporter 4TM/12TM fusion protein